MHINIYIYRQCSAARRKRCGRIQDDESAIHLSQPAVPKLMGGPLMQPQLTLRVRMRMIFLKWQFGGCISNFNGEPVISVNHHKTIHFWCMCFPLKMDIYHKLIEGSLEVKLPTIWTDGKAELGRVREEKSRREKIREEKESEERRCRCAKRWESRKTLCFFQWFVVPEGRKVGSLKQRVRSHLAKWEMTNCTPLWREAHLKVKRNKTPHVRTTFGSWDVEKVNAAVSRSTFRSQNVQSIPTSTSDSFGSWDVEKVHAVVAQNTFRSQNVQKPPASDHFWKLRCRKSVRRCGEKHVSKSKC